MEQITEDNCRDCLMGREDGIQWCPVHYDEAKDNARAIEQTGTGIPDVVAKQKAAVRQKCIEANSELVPDCSYGERGALARPIRLADVLLAIRGAVEENGGPQNEVVFRYWNLRADDLDQQSDETISFIHNSLV